MERDNMAAYGFDGRHGLLGDSVVGVRGREVR